MDRFIVLVFAPLLLLSIYLKSNMDRFIASKEAKKLGGFFDLKSNMDRFIETANVEVITAQLIFKIQYG